MKSLLAVLAASLAVLSAPTSASATVFIFEGNNGAYDTPTGNIALDCGSVGFDFCSANDALGLTYSKGGLGLTAVAYTTGGAPTQLIQDITPNDSGLGALSENDNINDQTQLGEYITLTFTDAVQLTSIEFNAGNDTNCSTPGSEGPCGFFDFFIDNVFFGNLEATDLLTGPFFGTSFRFVATTAGAGFAIAKLAIEDAPPIPAPAALPLLLAGLAGLGFASRRKSAR
ncbi:MAG: PEP-CTERM sorting domain-containing protein [Parvularculaceae bacterium]|nr:PEP-CTERM sorting domain-containing protein [Parvularculaceae bacterium]